MIFEMVILKKIKYLFFHFFSDMINIFLSAVSVAVVALQQLPLQDPAQ